MPTREHDNDQPGSPWSRTSVQLSALFLGMLLAVGIAIAIFHHGSSAKHPAANAPRGGQSRAAGTTTRAAASAGSCSLPAGSQQVPSSLPPSGVTWQVVGMMSVPQSPTLGPEHVENGINICFAHNPSGALLAAMNLVAESTTYLSERKVFDQLAIHVPSAVTTEPAIKDSQSGVQIAGYKYNSYAPATAQIDVAIQGPQGGLQSDQMTMVWTGDDWKYVFPPAGPIYSALVGDQLQPPYVSWSSF